MERKLRDLSRQISYALRHNPWLYELEMDDEGWVSVDQLLAGLKIQCKEWHGLNQDTINHVLECSDKRRYEVSNGRIRALYGHSLPGRLKKTPSQPPLILYHGTIRSVLGLIRENGLRPMGRQYVHLSVDKDTALKVAKRKRGESIILKIAASEAWSNGVRFYQGNDNVWLANFVPPTYISNSELSPHNKQ